MTQAEANGFILDLIDAIDALKLDPDNEDLADRLKYYLPMIKGLFGIY